MPFQNKCKAIKRLKNEKKKNYGVGEDQRGNGAAKAEFFSSWYSKQ